jgi:uncharacterized protein YydD (DUF2326 family)
MDYSAILVGAIPSVVSILLLSIQVLRDRKKEAALVEKVRAEKVVEEAHAADTIAAAAEKIVLRYEAIIKYNDECYAEEIKQLEQKIKKLEAEIRGLKKERAR